MFDSVLESFVESELSANTRRLLLDAIGIDASGQKRFGFNLFNIYINFEERTVIVQNILDVNVRQTLTIDRFRDVLTAAERPPQD